MKISMLQLKSLIREVILETAPGWSSAPQVPFKRKDTDIYRYEREQLGKLQHGDPDEDAVAPHLEEPELKPEDCWGPVPPTSAKPGVRFDPLARDYGPLPSPPISR
jgi:hypothetical protein